MLTQSQTSAVKNITENTGGMFHSDIALAMSHNPTSKTISIVFNNPQGPQLNHPEGHSVPTGKTSKQDTRIAHIETAIGQLRRLHLQGKLAQKIVLDCAPNGFSDSDLNILIEFCCTLLGPDGCVYFKCYESSAIAVEQRAPQLRVDANMTDMECTPPANSGSNDYTLPYSWHCITPRLPKRPLN